MNNTLRLVILLCSVFSVHFLNGQEKQHTAQPNVQILENVLTIPGLDRDRTLRIYLPPGYEQGKKRYPVLYMHDAQNLFDDATSYVGEWGVDEHLNSLAETDGLELIVVGIDNGQSNRNTELTPWANKRLGEPEGEAYTKFLVEVVKPYVDKNYRTKPGRKHTAIMGSSLGGLISHYAIYAYPKVFSKAGIFSPSYWVSEEAFSFTSDNPVPKNTRLYLLVGGQEGPVMANPMQRMYEFVKEQGHPAENISAKNQPEGKHNEAFWSSEFKEAIRWMFRK